MGSARLMVVSNDSERFVSLMRVAVCAFVSLQSDKKFLQNLENGVRFGKWILLENVSEKLDAALEPILLQQKFKQGVCGVGFGLLGEAYETIDWRFERLAFRE